ncbi:AraC family transcriptional regulator [Paenibacillus mendelii]|uniref:Helix-turn-helix domain-containing protein n=1 Tax=Paenibacillus mendelii TaxID=206163 RepID=A0ABV6JGP8_9BACL|nr:AraC family transcriptional regulator [Paenibacillus mendelii]MCQ6557493.1 AraC family transcriptional regulator [Paenibacillus mendelii]
MHHSVSSVIRRFRQSSVIKKLLLANLVFMLLLSGIMVYNYTYLKEGVKRQVLQTNQEFLSKLSGDLFAEWQQIRNAAYKLSVDPKSKLIANYPRHAGSYYTKMLDFKETLTEKNLTLPFRSQLMVYLPGQNLVVGSDGTRDLDVFYTTFGTVNPDFSCRCFHQGDDMENVYFYDKTIIYTYRVFPEGYIFVQIDKMSLQLYLKNQTKLLDNVILLSSPSNRSIVSTHALSPALINQLQGNPEHIAINDKTYTPIQQANDMLVLTTLFSDNSMQKQLNTANAYAFWLFFVFLAVNLGFLFVNWSMYRPLRRIALALSEYQPYFSSRNEFEIINDTFTQMNSATLSMQQTLADQSSIMEHHALLRLMADPTQDLHPNVSRSLKEKFDSYVILVLIEENNKGVQQWKIAPQLEMRLNRSHPCIRLYDRNEMTVYIVSCNDPRDVADIVDTIMDTVHVDGELSLCGISAVHDHLQEIGSAFRESIHAIHKFVPDIDRLRSTVLYRAGDRDKESMVQLSIDKEQELVNYTLKGNKDAVSVFFSGILGTLHSLTFEQVRNRLRYLHDLLMVLAGSKKIEIEQLWDIPPDCFRSYHIAYLFYRIREGYIIVAKMSERHSATLQQQIEAYIHCHYANPDLSLTRIADHLSITHVYLSTYFKKQSGYNLNAYIHSVRIQAAIQLMQSRPDMTMKDVADEVGYTNAGTFIRHFKKISGTTPTQHVKLQQE